MIRRSTSQAVAPRRQAAPAQARITRHRLRDSRAALAVTEVLEGNSDADWQLWEDATIAFEALFQTMRGQFAHAGAFAGIDQER